jgi:[ribosomal protein S5]-alanine N-acetyltransferase
MNNLLSVREIEPKDIAHIVDYWTNASDKHLLAMGVDVTKRRYPAELENMLTTQIQTPYQQKNSYCVIWELEGVPVGHCNTNPINYGKDAFMHLHVWIPLQRNKGYGVQFVKMTLPYFFNNLQLQELFCQPYALNPSPNKTIEKVGFDFVKEYITIPGPLAFEQPVKLWKISAEKCKELRYME